MRGLTTQRAVDVGVSLSESSVIQCPHVVNHQASRTCEMGIDLI